MDERLWRFECWSWSGFDCGFSRLSLPEWRLFCFMIMCCWSCMSWRVIDCELVNDVSLVCSRWLFCCLLLLVIFSLSLNSFSISCSKRALACSKSNSPSNLSGSPLPPRVVVDVDWPLLPVRCCGRLPDVFWRGEVLFPFLIDRKKQIKFNWIKFSK